MRLVQDESALPINHLFADSAGCADARVALIAAAIR